MKKLKVLTALLATTPVITAVTTVTSCSNNLDARVARDVVEKGYEEFLEIAKHPRPSGHTKEIREYLIQRIKELGYTPYTDVVSGEEDTQKNSQAANVWFDVPATKGYENYKKVVLQGHMDMVVAGLGDKEDERTWTTPIEVEYHSDGQYLTSKNHKTSLGADDGIGVGTLLALIQNKNIKHGPLRILITADEEIGMVGAKRLDASVLADYDYLINLDGELDDEGYYRSCQGAIQNNYAQTYTSAAAPTQGLNGFDIFVEGFQGGHSGQDMIKNRANATVFMCWLLSELNLVKSAEVENVEIVKFDYQTVQGEETTPSSTAIPSNSHVVIGTTKTASEIQAAFDETVSWFKEKYDGEDWTKIKLTVKTHIFQSNETVLDKETSRNVISLLSNCELGKFGFIYGYIPDPITGRPIVSANIGPLSIKSDADTPTTKYFNISTNGRSVAKASMEMIEELWSSAWYSHFPSGGLDPQYVIYPWEPNDSDAVQKLAYEGYKRINIEPYIKDTNGCVEPAPFCKLKPTLQQTCLGTKFVGVHTINETCYLKNLVNSIKVMKYMLANAK